MADKTKAELEKELGDAGLPAAGTKAELEEQVEALDEGRVHVPDRVVVQVRPGT